MSSTPRKWTTSKKNRRNCKAALKVEFLPSEYPCCADGICPQHLEQGKIDVQILLQHYRIDETVGTGRPESSKISGEIDG